MKAKNHHSSLRLQATGFRYYLRVLSHYPNKSGYMLPMTIMNWALIAALAGRILTSSDSLWKRAPSTIMLVVLLLFIFAYRPIVITFFPTPYGSMYFVNASWHVAALVLLIWQYVSKDHKAIRIASGAVAALNLAPVVVLTLIALAFMAIGIGK